MSDTPSPDVIERRLAQTRARLGDHLEELTRRLAPDKLVDEVVTYMRDGDGGVLMRNVGDVVRENPVPVALIGLGAAWLAIAGSGRGETHLPSRYEMSDSNTQDFQDSLAERARRAGEGISRTAGETEDLFRGRIAEARARVLGVQQQAAESASAFMDRVQQAFDSAQSSVRSAARQGSDRLSSAAGYSRDLADRASGGMATAITSNPLLLGAFAFTAGALLGSVLPMTETEENLLGDAGRQALDTAQSASDELLSRAREVAETATKAGVDAAREAVSSPD